MVCNLIECATPEYHRDGDQCIKTENEEDKNEEKDENKSGGQKSLSDKNGGNQQGGAAVVPGSKKKGSGSSDKDICENEKNAGTWMGTTCNCGTEKVWNTKNKRCEGFDEEETVKDEIKKCSADTLNAIKAKDGIVEGGKCKVTTCKGNLRKTSDNLNCECPGNDYKWNETKQTCEKNKQEMPDKKTPVLSVESENVELFKNVKVTFDQGVALANLYAEKYRLNFDCESGYKPGSDDYLTCSESSGKKYVFHFDSLTGGSDYTPVLDVMCKMYSGTGTRRIGNGKIMCQGIQLNLCDHMGRSIKKVIPNVSAGKYHDGITEVCVFSK